jgi:hypothetical protein
MGAVMIGRSFGGSRFSNWWAAAYTLGLAARVRDVRRAEIASDTWDQHDEESRAGRSSFAIAMSMLSRTLRGVPADVLWRINVEGPKMDIRIPLEKLAGVLAIALVALMMITGGIVGYDTSSNSFGDELTRLADRSALENNVNALVRLATGFGLFAAAAGFYVALRDRSRMLTTIVAFGLCAAGAIELVAASLQLAVVELAEEYAATSGTKQESVLAAARAVALAAQYTVFAGFMAIVLSTWVLAVLAGREGLVPRWLIGIPVMSVMLAIAGGIGAASGIFDGGIWIVYMAGLMLGGVWLIIAGLCLLFTPGTPGSGHIVAEGAAS